MSLTHGLPWVVTAGALAAFTVSQALLYIDPVLAPPSKLEPLHIDNLHPEYRVGDTVPVTLTGVKYMSCTQIVAKWQWTAVPTSEKPVPRVDAGQNSSFSIIISERDVNNLDEGPLSITYDVPVLAVAFSGLWQVRLDVLYNGQCDRPARRVVTTYSPPVFIIVGPEEALSD